MHQLLELSKKGRAGALDGPTQQKLLGAIETACASPEPRVCGAAWKAFRELSLLEAELCALAIERGLPARALSQLHGPPGAAPTERRLCALGVLWNLSEACPEALDSFGAAEMATLCALAAGEGVREGGAPGGAADEGEAMALALAALQLLLVVTDGEPRTAALLRDTPGWRQAALARLQPTGYDLQRMAEAGAEAPAAADDAPAIRRGEAAAAATEAAARTEAAAEAAAAATEAAAAARAAWKRTTAAAAMARAAAAMETAVAATAAAGWARAARARGAEEAWASMLRPSARNCKTIQRQSFPPMRKRLDACFPRTTCMCW